VTTEWPKALRNDLSALIEGSVNDDRQLIERLANDLSPASGAFPDVVARPANAEDVVAIVRYCTDRGLPVYPRGAGISYTNAYVPQRSGGVLLDTLELNRVVTVASDERFVVVEAGVTWQQLLEHLSPLGLRTPFWGRRSRRTAPGSGRRGTGRWRTRCSGSRS
jgi:FAD/FMN-containing dehydrogenase